MLHRRSFLLAALGALLTGLVLGPASSPAQVGKKGVKLVNPPNFNYQVNFATDYIIKPTPAGFKFGTSAFTSVSANWQSGPNGKVTITSLAVNRSQSWVYDWVFHPQTIGATPATVANLRAHEQVHFDLTALAVREFLNQAQGLPGNQVQTLWSNFMNRLHTLDALYESSTQQGLILSNQNLWVQQIGFLKSRSDGTFTTLEQWAQRFRS